MVLETFLNTEISKNVGIVFGMQGVKVKCKLKYNVQKHFVDNVQCVKIKFKKWFISKTKAKN